MAERGLIHKDDTPRFKSWLLGDGWTLEQEKGMYEAVRARKGKKVAIFYFTNKGKHLSFEDKLAGLAFAYLRHKKSLQGR